MNEQQQEELTLFGLGFDGYIEPMEDGQYVSLSDYMDLETKLKAAQADAAWIPVSERLPNDGTEVIVYTPPLNGEDERCDFEKYEDECFVAHHNNYEHFCIVAKGGSDCAWSGPSEKPKYTHWKKVNTPTIKGEQAA